jgi:exodeoxyribonuclease VII large subunit
MRPEDTLELPFGAGREVLSVSQLNREARLTIERGFGTVWVEGEVSNFSRPSSGHWYFSLKDAQAQIRCAMFRGQNRHARLVPEDGRQVLVRARVTLYEARGEFQLVVDYLEAAGEGELRRRFEALKRQLEAEGLFDPARKQPLPALPARIGVVTSPTGAALRDVLTALRRRFPAAAVLIYPTAVQGDGAAAEIARTLELADRRAECDLLILTRGGGSLEDLQAFNAEPVARAIAALVLPIIVGVGHETDFTIADFVADLRAPTPSQAAELAVPDQGEWRTRLARDGAALARAATRALAAARRDIAVLSHRLHRAHPGVAVGVSSQRLDELEARLRRALERALADRTLRLGRLTAAVAAANPRERLRRTRDRWNDLHRRLGRAVLDNLSTQRRRAALAERALTALSPLATLARGFAIVSRSEDGAVIRDSRELERGSRIDVRLARGRLAAEVERSEPDQ